MKTYTLVKINARGEQEAVEKSLTPENALRKALSQIVKSKYGLVKDGNNHWGGNFVSVFH